MAGKSPRAAKPGRRKGSGVGDGRGRKKGERENTRRRSGDVAVSASDVKMAMYKSIVKKMAAGKKLTAADMALVKEVEAEEKARAAAQAEEKARREPRDEVLHNGGATAEEDITEFILREGVVRGQVRRFSQVAMMHQLKLADAEKLLWKIQRELLETYGFEGAKKSGKLDGTERQALQWVKSIGQLSAVSQEWELQMESVRRNRVMGSASDRETFESLVETMKKLADRRDTLVLKIRELSAKEKRAGTARGAKATSFAIVVKNDKL